MKQRISFIIVALLIGLVACEKDETTYVNGTYKAEDAEFHYGWKAFIEVVIADDAQTDVTFDYVDDSGNLKSATTDEDYPMDPHPRVWCRTLETQLMAVDILNITEVDGVTGATSGSDAANALFALALDAAKDGDTSTQIRPAE